MHLIDILLHFTLSLSPLKRVYFSCRDVLLATANTIDDESRICERCKFRASTEVLRFSCSCISLPPDLSSFSRKHAAAFGECLESTSFGIFPNGRTKVASAVRSGGLFKNKSEFVTVNAFSLVCINNFNCNSRENYTQLYFNSLNVALMYLNAEKVAW